MSYDYFFLDSNCLLVTGAVNAAIYDFSKGDVYSIDNIGSEILRLCQQALPISIINERVQDTEENEVIDFLKKLETLQLGNFNCNPLPSQKAELHPPVSTLKKIWLELTNNCNLRCVHCYADSSPKKDDNSLNLKQWKSIISEASILGARWIQFIGGEPLLYGKRNLFELVLKAKKVKFDFVEIFSNGVLMDDEYVDFFAEHDVHIALSIFSKRPEIHDKITRRSGSFQHIMKIIEKLHQREVPFRLGMVLMKQNFEYEEETLEWIKTTFAGANVSCDIIRCTFDGRKQQMSLLTPTLWRKKLRTEPNFPKVTLDTFARNKFGHPCLNGLICVHADGKVYPCIMDREHILGSVTNSTLKEIIENLSTQEIWGLSKDQIPVCRDCEYRYACFDCRPASLMNSEAIGKSRHDFRTKDLCCLYDPHKGKWENADEFMDKVVTKESLAKS